MRTKPGGPIAGDGQLHGRRHRDMAGRGLAAAAQRSLEPVLVRSRCSDPRSTVLQRHHRGV